MKIAIHQPNFMPNIGFFYKMNLVEKFVIITNLKFEKREGWQRRHKIIMNEKDFWLTVPVIGSDYQMIKDVQVNNQINWRHKHKMSLQTAYGKTPHKDVLNRIQRVYEKKWERLADLNIALIYEIAQILDLDSKVVVDEETTGEKHELLVNVSKKHGAKVYVSGIGGRDYMTEEHFQEMEKIDVSHEFVEKNKTGEYPYSIIHYLLTKGPKWTKNAIQS